MEFQGYNISEKNQRVVIDHVRDFDPVHVFECGQCFRWIKGENGSYTGVVGDKAARIRYAHGQITIENSTVHDVIHHWFDYFDLGTDYTRIKEELAQKDPIMKEAVAHGQGIRLLKQDLWETLISFIVSVNNRIPRIMKIIAAISKVFGEELQFDGKSFYTFPQVEALASSEVEQLAVCRGGYRCKYIVHTSRMVREKKVDLSELKRMRTAEAKEELMKLPGVGPKVADCVLLYSGTKKDVFPTDVWVKRVMEELYFKREATFKEIQAFASEYFGELAGVAQQYLFYYAREKKIGINEGKRMGN